MVPGEGVPTQRWAYPDVDGRKQGGVDFYCDMTAKACYPTSEEVKDMKNKLVDPDAFSKFRDDLAEVVNICAEKQGEGVSVVKLRQSLAASSVEKQQRTSFAHKNHGKCLSVERFKAVFKKAPEEKDIKQRKRADGKVVDYVKVYDNDRDDEWSFSEAEEDAVLKKNTIDDGLILVHPGQLDDKYQQAAGTLMGDTAQSSGRLSRQSLGLEAAPARGAAPQRLGSGDIPGPPEPSGGGIAKHEKAAETPDKRSKKGGKKSQKTIQNMVTKMAKTQDYILNTLLPELLDVLALNLACDSLPSFKARDPACKDALKKAKGKVEQLMEIIEEEYFASLSRVEPKHVSALKEAQTSIEGTQVAIKAWVRYSRP